MSHEQEVERMRADNAELRQLLVTSQQQVAQLTQQVAAAVKRIAELEAQVNQRGGPPAFVKPKRPKAASGRQLRKRMQATRIERHARYASAR